MKPNCLRCGSSALASFTIEAEIGTTQLKISRDADKIGICASCIIGLADWLGNGHESRNVGVRAALDVLAAETAGAVGRIAT
jgi:hypothetical protein